MSHLTKLVASHPIDCVPYNKLVYVRHDAHGPLYTVDGRGDPAGAYNALGIAFARYGGRCFYCSARFEAQPLSNEVTGAHRDHVVAKDRGGSQLLHNLVIACGNCGRTKANDPVHDFRPRAAKAYLDALNKHIEECVKQANEARASSRPRPKRGEATGP